MSADPEDHDSRTNLLRMTRERTRILLLLDALERVGITPVSARKLHAFAYLADVLSPVWGLPAFDGKILKIEGGPHYADLQRELDGLVILGLVTILGLQYQKVGNSGYRIDGEYQLTIGSKNLPKLLRAIGAEGPEDALDPRDSRKHTYLEELAGALATLPDDEIDAAANVDATYSDRTVSYSNVIEFDRFQRSSRTPTRNKSVEVTQRFEEFLPEDSRLSSGQKVYLYASYLGRLINE